MFRQYGIEGYNNSWAMRVPDFVVHLGSADSLMEQGQTNYARNYIQFDIACQEQFVVIEVIVCVFHVA